MKKFFTILFLFAAVSSRATVHLVEVEDYEFNPSVMTINLGDSVMWIWHDGFHTTTSTNIPTNATPWVAAIDQNNSSYVYVATVAGSYDYQCDYHYGMGMVGHFTVNDPLSVGHVDNKNIIRLRSSRVTEYLTVEMPELQQDVVPIVRDLTGRVVQTFDAIAPGTTTLFVGTLKNGIYLLELSSATLRISYRFIKY